jgi:outer membrane receptor for ferrienterochelin and colicin
MITGVQVNADKVTFKDINMETTAVEMETFEVVEYTVPLIEKDNTTSGQTMTNDDIDKMATRSAAGIATQVGGVVAADDGSGNLNFRGARNDANYVFIDGIKVRAGSNSLPQSSIEQISVMTGGIPAQYGDVTGGVISITTRGAARDYGGSVEYLTSGYKFNDNVVGFDPYAYNLLEFSAFGPLFWKKDSSNSKTEPLLGFFVAGNFNYRADGRPSHLGNWKVKDEVMQDLINNPLRYNPSGSGTATMVNFSASMILKRQNKTQR